MSNQDKALKSKEAFRKVFSQTLGLNLVDEIIEGLLSGEGLSIEQLSKYYTLTEIGTALIRMDALCDKPCHKDCKVCILKCCLSDIQIPPDED